MHSAAKVQIVADQPEVCESLIAALGSGFLYVTAHSQADAVRQFQTTPIDLVVTHLDTPEENGLSYLDRLRAAGKTVPFILLSSLPSLEATLQSMRLKVTAYVPTPFDPAELKSLAEDTISHLRETRAILEDPSVRASVVGVRTQQRLLADLDHLEKQLQRQLQLLAAFIKSASKLERPALGASVDQYANAAVREFAHCLRILHLMTQNARLLAPPRPGRPGTPVSPKSWDALGNFSNRRRPGPLPPRPWPVSPTTRTSPKPRPPRSSKRSPPCSPKTQALKTLPKRPIESPAGQQNAPSRHGAATDPGNPASPACINRRTSKW